MPTQFNLAHIRPSADGKWVEADVMSSGFDPWEARRYGVREVEVRREEGDPQPEHPRVRFPAGMLVFGSILDLGRGGR